MKAKQSNKQPQEPTLEQLTSGLVISVKEARKILGAEGKGLSDTQIALFILDFSDFAPDLLKYKQFVK